jgi:hypothetical protein
MFGYVIPKGFYILIALAIAGLYLHDPWNIDERTGDWVSSLGHTAPIVDGTTPSTSSGINQSEAQKHLSGVITWNDAGKFWQNDTHGYGANGLFSKTTATDIPKPAGTSAGITAATLPTVDVSDAKETGDWTDSDKKNIAEEQKIGSKTLDISSASSTIKGAIEWASLKASKDKFIAAFADDKKTQEGFGEFLKRTDSIWGGDGALSCTNSDGYATYLVKYSSVEYFWWQITPDYQTGDFPTDKNDLKTITYGSDQPTQNPEVNPSADTGTDTNFGYSSKTGSDSQTSLSSPPKNFGYKART